MTKISEEEFSRICQGIYNDREIIIKHNPIGSNEEILLWMLLSCLLIYLNIEEKEIPCFPNTINAETYRSAIIFSLQDRKEKPFSVEKYLSQLS
jgi:hypothetical protein